LFQPVIAALLAWLILAERINGKQAMGGCVILLGIVIASRGKAGKVD
jgi:drug/metabolite transporter (DMT)-like permease